MYFMIGYGKITLESPLNGGLIVKPVAGKEGSQP